jgi:hypothetical protein
MEKIISPTLTVEAVYECAWKIKEASSLEIKEAEIKPQVTILTSLGYDDEIKLWEEQLQKGNHGKIHPPAGKMDLPC